MLFSLAGLICISFASNFIYILLSVSLIGMGSSIFHPEASRVAHLASGGKKGLAQSIFQVGGNAGGAIGPLLVALIVIPLGQQYIGVFGVLAIVAVMILTYVGNWYQIHLKPKTQTTAVGASKPTCQNQSSICTCNFIGTHFFQIFLHGFHDQLFHLLFDQ
jgi:FSR family fosmidomycin resistance protein-like MFS transporter